MENEMIVLETSDEAAHFVTGLSGWVSRSGRFWGADEHMARWEGCTHTTCGCGKIMERGWTKCPECRKKAADERFNAMPKKEWDGETPITLLGGDEYFFNREQLKEWCEDWETTPDKLQLVICEPNYACEIDSDFYCDDLPEDQSLEDVAPELADKISEVNKYIRDKKPILSWGPGKIAALV
jgi:hypothetical protein